MKDIQILCDGQHWIAVDKPAGLSTQSPPSGDSLENRLRRQLAGRGGYLAIVHRLDRSVGGVVLVALRRKEARLLSQQFAARKVVKQYAAVVAGQVAAEVMVWTDHLRKIVDQPRAEVCQPEDSGAKAAETRVERIACDPDTNCSHLRLFPHTGRMHQLRIQAAHRGHPMVGDADYGGPPSETLMLRAESIQFHDPSNGRRVTVRAAELSIPATFGY